MVSKVFSVVAGAALAAAQCTIPTEPLSSTISTYFRLQVQNASEPTVHNKYFNLFEAGGGDQHLFIGPVGRPTYDLTLQNGVIYWQNGVHAVIGGEFSEIDHTTKLFMTERMEPAAIFQPTYACNPDTGLLQVELHFQAWGETPGGWICVRPTWDDGHEFRYYPPGNTLVDVNRECIKVTLAVIPTSGAPSSTLSTSVVSSTPASSASSVASSSASSVVSSSSSAPPSSSSSAPPANPTGLYTDMTAQGWRFIGCAPEERWAGDGPFRTLPHALLGSDVMTNEVCMAHCGGLGYAYAGTEWSRECWCGNSYAPTREPATTVASLANCNYRCSGSTAQFCGGDAWLSLYAKCPTGGPCVNAAFS